MAKKRNSGDRSPSTGRRRRGEKPLPRRSAAAMNEAAVRQDMTEKVRAWKTFIDKQNEIENREPLDRGIMPLRFGEWIYLAQFRNGRLVSIIDVHASEVGLLIGTVANAGSLFSLDFGQFYDEQEKAIVVPQQEEGQDDADEPEGVSEPEEGRAGAEEPADESDGDDYEDLGPEDEEDDYEEDEEDDGIRRFPVSPEILAQLEEEDE